jgi:hypothetical protein
MADEDEDEFGYVASRKRVAPFVVVIVVAIFIIITDLDPRKVDRDYEIGFKLLLLALAVGLAVAVRARVLDNLNRKLKPFPRHQVGSNNAEKILTKVKATTLNPFHAEFFAVAFTTPRRVRQRIVDSYTPAKRELLLHVSIEGQVPASTWKKMQQESDKRQLDEAKAAHAEKRYPVDPATAPKTFYFPVIMPFKGKMLDNLRVTDASGTAITVLSYRESLELSAGVLHQLLEGWRQKQGVPADNPAFLHARIKALEQMILRRTGKLPVIAPGESDVGFKKITALPAANKTAERIRNIASLFAERLVENFCIVAVVTPDENGRFYINYEQSIVPDLDLTQHKNVRSRLMARLRIAMGTRPANVLLDVQNAMICQSYHLRVTVPSSLYCVEQQVIGFADILKTKDPDCPTPPHVRFGRRLGLPYAHFYCRYLPLPARMKEEPAPKIPRLRFRFVEVPPGSLMRALVTASAAAILIWIVSRISAADPDSGSDAPAYLLAFPAVVAAWMGFEAPTDRLFEGTLRARLALLITVVTSLAGSALYMAHQAVPKVRTCTDCFTWPSNPSNISFLGLTDAYWTILLMAAIANALYICYRYYLNVWKFYHYSSREGSYQVNYSD